MNDLIQDEIITRVAMAQEQEALTKSFGEDEARKIADFFNRMDFDDTSKGRYKFEVLKFKEDEVKMIDGVNKFREKPLIDLSGGYYVAAIDAYQGSAGGKAGDRNYRTEAPVILRNPDGNLVFSQQQINVKARPGKGEGLDGSDKIFEDITNKFELKKIDNMDFVVPDPFANSNVITALDGKKRITSQIVRIGENGTQEIMNADYPSFVKQLMEGTSSNYYAARTGSSSTDDIKYKMAKNTITSGYSNISGKTNTDITTLGLIKGTQGMNSSSRNAYTSRKYNLSPELVKEYDLDSYNNMYDDLQKGIGSDDKLISFDYVFDNNNDVKSVYANVEVDDLGKVSFRMDENLYKDSGTKTRFNEYLNDVVSKVSNYATPKANSEETLDQLNAIVDSYAEAAKKAKADGVEGLPQSDDYAKKIQSIIKAAFNGRDNGKIEALTGDGGPISIPYLKAMVANGIKFSDLLDVNRQSLNTEDVKTQLNGGTLDVGAVVNKVGQRNAQADAKLGKAVLTIDGEEVNLSQIAKGWSSDISEMKYKKMTAQNPVAEQMIVKAQEELYGKKLASSYFSQQNYLLQTFHDGAFQDSNMMSADLSLENISKFDDKNSLFVPYNAMNSSVLGEEGFGDLSKLSSENYLVEGSTENTIFRNLLGEENYNKHLDMKKNIVEDYKNVGKNYNGIENLQSAANRKTYALANNQSIIDTNKIHDRYFVSSDSAARSEIINKNAVINGQARHITGANYVSIDGIEFTSEGARLKTTGIINHGDSVKFMIDGVKSTTQSVQASLGMKLDNGVYLPLSGLNSEKILSKKRGFTGDLLYRSMATMAFNYTTLGNSDNMEENFNTWKKAMETDFAAEGVNGKKVSIFEATGIDVDFNEKGISFINRNTQEALADYDFRTNKLTGSVNAKINGAIEDRASRLFGINLFNNDGKDYTQKLFGEMLGRADAELVKTLKGNVGGLDETTRRSMAGLFANGTIETIGISKGEGVFNNLGWAKGIKLLSNIHIMQETKSRADEDGLSIGRLSQMIMRENQRYGLADDIEEEIGFRAVKRAEKYMALTGSFGYGGLDAKDTKGYEIFSENSIDMKSPSLRYNVDGTNTTLENFMKKSALGEVLSENFDVDKGRLKKTVAGKLIGFNEQFLDVVNSFSGAKGKDALYSTMGALNLSDMTGSLIKQTSGKNAAKFEFSLKAVTEGVMKRYDKFSVIESFEGERLNFLSDTIGTIGFKNKDKLFDDVGLGRLNKLSETELGDLISLARMDGKSRSEVYKTLDEDRQENLNKLIKFDNKNRKSINAYVEGNAALDGKWGTKAIGAVEFDSSDKHVVNKMMHSILENSEDADNFSSDANLVRNFIDRIEDYTGENAFNLKQLQEIGENNQMRYIIDEVAADNNGMLITKSNLTGIERLIKQNSDLGEMNERIKLLESKGKSFGEAELIEKAERKANDLLGKFSSSKKQKDLVAKKFEKIVSEKNVSNAQFEKLSVSKKMEILANLEGENISKYQMDIGINAVELENKAKSINKFRDSTIDDVFNAILQMGEGSSYQGNATAALANSAGSKQHGYVLETLMNEIKGLEENGIIDSKAQLRHIKDQLALINGAVDSSSSGADKNGVAVMIKEKDEINDVIEVAMKKFFGRVDFDKNREVGVNHKIKAFVEKDFGNLSKEDAKKVYGYLEKELTRNRNTEYSMGVASELSRLVGKNNAKDELDELIESRNKLKLRMVDTVRSITSDLSDNFFKKGGAAMDLATMRFKNSVEFSPTEKTIASSYITDEFEKVMKNKLNKAGDGQDQKDLFKAMRMMFGDEIVDDIYTDYDKIVNGPEIKNKEDVVNSFRIGLKKRLDDLSGIVIGTKDDFRNAGLGDMVGTGNKSSILDGILSRNPHQYMGSARATRFLALGEEDRNLSFFKGMFGDLAKIGNTQGNLGLFGKRTAIAAHGDHDGDKFQAMFMTADDFTFKQSKMSKDELAEYLRLKNVQNDMYRLLGDYGGNLREASESNSQTAVEKGIFKKARESYKLGNISDKETFNKIKNIYWAQRTEYRRTSAEILDENLSHAEVAYFKIANSVKKGDDAKAFDKVVKEMSGENKLAVLANTLDYDDIGKIDSFFDEETLKDADFSKALEKVKKIVKNRDDAEVLIKEFGTFGVDKIKWSNAALSDSSFAAYTGLNRTGVVHAPLTNIRDGAISLFSRTRKNRLFESLDKRGLKADSVLGFKNMYSGYVKANSFMTTSNDIGTVIEKLAISSKLGDGSNPYSIIKNFKETQNSLNRAVEIRFRAKKRNINGAFRFDNLEDTYEFLSDNEKLEFDYSGFTKRYGQKGLFSDDTSISSIVEHHMAKILFPKAFDNGELPALKELLSNKQMVKDTELTNAKFLKTMSNAFAIIGNTILDTTSGINDSILDHELNSKNAYMPSSYSSGKNAFVGEKKNIFHNLFKAWGEDIGKNGYNPEYGVWDQIKKLLKDMRSSDGTTTGGNAPPETPPKATESGDKAVKTEDTSSTKVVKSAEEEANMDFNKSEKAITTEEPEVKSIVTESNKVKEAPSKVIETTTDESIEAIEEAIPETKAAKVVKEAKKRGRKSKVKPEPAEALAESQEIEVKAAAVEAEKVTPKAIETTADESVEMIQESIPETQAGKVVKEAKKRGRKTKAQTVDPNQTSLDFGTKETEMSSAKAVQSTSAVQAESVLNENNDISSARLKQAEEELEEIKSQSVKLQEALEGKNKELDAIQTEISSVNSKLDDSKISLSDAKDEIAKLTNKMNDVEIEKQDVMKNMGKNISDERKAASSVRKQMYEMQAEHKKALSNLNSAHSKAIDAKDSQIKELTEKMARFTSKLEANSKEAAELKETLKAAQGMKGGMKSVFKEVSENISEVGENAKKLYNVNKKITIGAGVTAVLGTAFSLLQGSRPIMDVDLRQSDMEKQNGSVYQNLGSYGINTNIRGIR